MPFSHLLFAKCELKVEQKQGELGEMKMIV